MSDSAPEGEDALTEEGEPGLADEMAEPSAAEDVKSNKAEGKSVTRAAAPAKPAKKAVPTTKRAVGRGRYTAPIPREVRHSARWYPWVLLSLLIIGLLMIVLNYVSVLPRSPSNWYLIGGFGAVVVGLFMATFYH